jgi:excisionase family DNA binding protein
MRSVQSDPNISELMTPAEVARLFRVDPKTVTRWAKSGKLHSNRTIGGHRRFKRDEVLKIFNDTDDRASKLTEGTSVSYLTARDRLTKRLKAAGLVPRGIPIEIMIYPAHSKTRGEFRWEAINASTKEPLKVGSPVMASEMGNHEWNMEKRNDGWMVLTAGKLIPVQPRSAGAGIQIRGGWMR